MIVYNVGDKIKIKETTAALGVTLVKGTMGIIVAVHSGRVEAVFEGAGLVSVGYDIIEKKVRKVEKFVKAKNLKLTDEVYLPGTGEFNKIASIGRVVYDAAKPEISVESVIYDEHSYDYNELVTVRR